MLACVHVRGMPAGLSAREHAHQLNALVSLAAEKQVCAAGALVAILSREGLLRGDAPGDAGALRGWLLGAGRGAAPGASSGCSIILLLALLAVLPPSLPAPLLLLRCCLAACRRAAVSHAR